MVFGKKPSSDKPQPDQWKKKYYDSLDDLEYKEEQWSKAEKLLRNAVVRISLASDPSQERLSKLLNSLREDIRRGKDSLNLAAQLEKITAVIRDLGADESEEVSVSNSYSASKLVEECIERIKWSDKAKQLKRGLSRQFRAIKDDDVQQFIHSYTKILNQEFIWFKDEIEEANNSAVNKNIATPENKATETQAPENKTLENKNRSEELSIKAGAINSEAKDDVGKIKTSHVENDVEGAVDTEKSAPLEYSNLLLSFLKNIPERLIDESQGRQLKLKATSCRTREEALRIIEAIGSSLGVASSDDAPQENNNFEKYTAAVLIEFLELISLPDELSTKAENIRQILILDSSKLKPCLIKTVELVMEIQVEIRSERKELEDFLAELGVRLKEIDDEVKKLAGVSDKRFNNFNAMNESLNETVDSIDEFSNSETDIDSLKDSVKSHVIMIRHHMDTCLTEEGTHKKYSDEVVEKLARELQNVKQEADALREQLEKKRLQATHDTLTRIPNRFAYDEWIAQEHERFVRYDSPFVLMVWDVDFFKRVNDEFGHQAGDKVLRIIAQMLSENIREADFVARYGGEEFVVVLPGTVQASAMKIAGNIRAAIGSCAFHFKDKPVKVTASAGICEVKAGESIEELFERADKALYKAKHNGRNQCVAG